MKAIELREQVQQYLEKAKELKAQAQALEARQRAKEKEKRRAQDTHRKILTGAYVLENAEKNSEAKNRLLSGLDKFLVNNRDGVLFGLTPIPEKIEKGNKVEAENQEAKI